MIDQRCVEVFLVFERRTDQPPDERAKPALQRTIDARRAGRKDVPGAVDGAQSGGVVRGGWIRQAGDRLNRAVEGRERGIVEPGGFAPFTIQPGDEILDGLVGQGGVPARLASETAL